MCFGNLLTMYVRCTILLLLFVSMDTISLHPGSQQPPRSNVGHAYHHGKRANHQNIILKLSKLERTHCKATQQLWGSGIETLSVYNELQHLVSCKICFILALVDRIIRLIRHQSGRSEESVYQPIVLCYFQHLHAIIKKTVGC